ncbi:MAG: lysozyme inhibitor LprI family protein [Bdellovibrionaceae bacterium]|nr:lysozyme inhibitor LprI family protein [Pseudobdellovibrionaceae bacterium]
MKTRIDLILFSWVFTAAMNVAAAPVSTCDEAPASTLQQEACLAQRVRNAQARVDQMTRELRKRARRIDPIALYFIGQGEKKWQTYMELNCRSESYDAFGGSLMETLELKCQTRLLNQRASELERWKEKLTSFFRLCPLYKSESADQNEYRRALEEMTAALDKVGRYLDDSKIFDPGARATITRTFSDAQESWRTSRSQECMARYLLFCKNERLRPEARDAWLRRCESTAIRNHARELRMRVQSLNDAFDMSDVYEAVGAEPVAH